MAICPLSDFVTRFFQFFKETSEFLLLSELPNLQISLMRIGNIKLYKVYNYKIRDIKTLVKLKYVYLFMVLNHLVSQADIIYARWKFFSNNLFFNILFAFPRQSLILLH